jgi:hypothetical protein
MNFILFDYKYQADFFLQISFKDLKKKPFSDPLDYQEN